MRRLLHLAGTMAVAAAVAGPALADPCETEVLPAALGAAKVKPSNGEEFAQLLQKMEGYVAACPEHPWVNMMLATMDFLAYQALTDINDGVPNQEGVNHLLRGFVHIGKFMDGPDELRRDRFMLATPSGPGDLRHSTAVDLRKAIITKLMQIAKMGSVHPYLSGTEPVACEGWLTSDARTVAYAIDTKEDLIFLPFVDAAAEACEAAGDTANFLPLALKAKVYAEVVEKAYVTDTDEIRRMLRSAKDAQVAYLRGRESDVFYSKSDVELLGKLMRAHAVTADSMMREP